MPEKYKVYKLSNGKLLVKNTETKSTKIFSSLPEAEEYIKNEVDKVVSFRFYRKYGKLIDVLSIDKPIFIREEEETLRNSKRYAAVKAMDILLKFYDDKADIYVIDSEDLTNIIILSILDMLYLEKDIVLLEESDCAELNDMHYVLSRDFNIHNLEDFSDDMEFVKKRYKDFGFNVPYNMEFSYNTYNQDSYGALIDDILLASQQSIGLVVTENRNLKLVKIRDKYYDSF